MQIKKGQHLSATTEFKKGQNTGENNFNWKGGLVKTNCKFCNKEFYIKPSRIKIGIGKFCSKSCNAKSRTGKNGAN